jgi:hypothetical protein
MHHSRRVRTKRLALTPRRVVLTTRRAMATVSASSPSPSTSIATVVEIDASAIRVVTIGPRLPPNTRIRVRAIAQKDDDAEDDDDDVAPPGLDDTVTLAMYGWRARAFIDDGIVHDAVLHASPRIETHVMDGVDATLCAGLEAATLSARVGQRLGVVVPSGGAPFASAPFDAPRDVYIEYEFEVLSIARTGGLSVDARDEDAKRYADAKKSEANELFSRGEYARALRRYDDGANALARVLMSGTGTQDDVKATERVLVTFHVNAAATLLKLERFVDVCRRCDDALYIEATNVKAMYRKSQALEALGELASALEVLREALELSKDRAIREAFVRVRRQITAANDAERAVYGRMMDGDAMAAMEAKEQNATVEVSTIKGEISSGSVFERCSKFCRERPFVVASGASMFVVAAVFVARARGDRTK